MRISVERLRVWLVVGAALLVLVIAGFLGYARYRTHRFLAGLPGKLGIDIVRETNGYTYSQSIGPNTVMTLHAARAVEHKDGKLTLHDVSVILYGRKQKRADRIYGSQFEYDQKNGVVRAEGEVHIDLQAPSSAPPGVGGKDLPVAPPAVNDKAANDRAEQDAHLELAGTDKRVIHIKTSGLVYIQKLAVAATDQPLEFQFGGITGHARGAEYNSDSGMVILQADVKANGLEHETPFTLTATHAEIDRQNQRTVLTAARYATPQQTTMADRAIVYQRNDGSPERIEGEGHVTLTSRGDGSIAAPRGDVLLNIAGKAQSAHLTGGVTFEDAESLREGKGQSMEASLVFDAKGHPQSAVLTGAVHVFERVRSSAAAAAWSTREGSAGRMNLVFADDGTGQQRQLREAEADNSAHLTLVDDAGLAGRATTEIAGDTLRASFIPVGRTQQISELHGLGHTSLRRVTAQGAEQTSSGDTLEANFRATPRRSGAGNVAAGSEEIAHAVQSGHVVLTSQPAPKQAKSSTQSAARAATHATGEQAVYDGDTDQLTLSGHAQIAEDAGTVSADRIVMQHASGDAIAVGAVKANYLQPNATEPVHVLADHAELRHDEQRALFYGTAAKPARMWQGASQVEAPVLELDQEQRRLTARGDASAGGTPIHAVLVANSSAAPKPGALGPRTSVVRIASRTMVYLDASRQIDFTGGVQVEDGTGTMKARQATAYLRPAPAEGASASKKSSVIGSKGAPAGIFFGGGVERIVATGKIELEQPGRRASGEQLVYTAGDGMFVLTGTTSAPPRLTDEVQGTVTGTSLRFHTGDDSVTVVGETGSSGQRVHTVTRVRQK